MHDLVGIEHFYKVKRRKYECEYGTQRKKIGQYSDKNILQIKHVHNKKYIDQH